MRRRRRGRLLPIDWDAPMASPFILSFSAQGAGPPGPSAEPGTSSAEDDVEELTWDLELQDL